MPNHDRVWSFRGQDGQENLTKFCARLRPRLRGHSLWYFDEHIDQESLLSPQVWSDRRLEEYRQEATKVWEKTKRQLVDNQMLKRILQFDTELRELGTKLQKARISEELKELEEKKAGKLIKKAAPEARVSEKLKELEEKAGKLIEKFGPGLSKIREFASVADLEDYVVLGDH